MEYQYIKHVLFFKVPGGTSRGVLSSKDSWFVIASQDKKIKGIGECSLIKGLSPDKPEEVEEVIQRKIKQIYLSRDNSAMVRPFPSFPAVNFCFEMISKGPLYDDPYLIEDSPFARGEEGIEINGLVWMGSKEYMSSQIKEKIEKGYRCIKLKIGAIDFDEECSLLASIRKNYTRKDIDLRVDANGAFAREEALEKLKVLSRYDLHSIEQPILPGQWDIMAHLCEHSPIKIALDEELIGLEQDPLRTKMLDTIRPHYLVLKPSLLGGLEISDHWIKLAVERGVGWWATSALESNIGLNAIAKWVAAKKIEIPQGLGTGRLFSNNIPSPLFIDNGRLHYNSGASWSIPWIEAGNL